MSEINAEVGELSKMKRELSADSLEYLKGDPGKYVDRLTAVADATFGKSRLLSGTLNGSPSVLTHGRRGRLREVRVPRGMYFREMKTPEGTLSMFPLHIIGLTNEGVPIIDPDVEGSYAVVHIPAGSDSQSYEPANMSVDMAFTVDQDNLVTVDGQNTVTAEEYALFDAVVNEFERRAQIKQ